MVPFLQKATISEKVPLLKKQDTFFPREKKSLRECQPVAQGLFSPKYPGERPLKYGGDSLKYYPQIPKYGPIFTENYNF